MLRKVLNKKCASNYGVWDILYNFDLRFVGKRL
jgi:hypothetical protein